MSLDFAVSLLHSTIVAGTPLLLATLGEVYAERSGILNLGIEGMMSVGALAAFMVCYNTGDPMLGVIVAAIAGALVSLVHAFLSISLAANQIISGLALTFLGLGLSGFLGREMVGKVAPTLSAVPIPILSNVPILGHVLFNHDLLVYLSLILAFLMWIALYKTKPGLSIRSVGENPAMADSMGVNVYLTRYACVFVGGLLAGLSGAYLSLAYTPGWIEGMVHGRGFIAVALTILALWDPLRAVLSAYLFGGVEVLRFRLQALGIMVRHVQFLLMLPYLVTMVVLTLLSLESVKRRISMPAALCVPYQRE